MSKFFNNQENPELTIQPYSGCHKTEFSMEDFLPIVKEKLHKEVVDRNVRHWLENNTTSYNSYGYNRIEDCGLEIEDYEELYEQMTESNVFSTDYFLSNCGDDFDLMLITNPKPNKEVI